MPPFPVHFPPFLFDPRPDTPYRTRIIYVISKGKKLQKQLARILLDIRNCFISSSYFAERSNMRIMIGITREPGNIQELLSKYNGNAGSLTEIGPFVSKVEALNWLVYLKSRIGDIEEIIPELQSSNGAVWYGFTFEIDVRQRNVKRSSADCSVRC